MSECNQLPINLPAYYDILIIPKKFYKAVIDRNINETNNIIKNNPKLSVSVVNFYDTILKGSFFYKKAGKSGSSYKIHWNNIVMNYNEQAMLYQFITTQPWNMTSLGFLINAINNYLVQLRYVLGLINNKIPANNFYNLGVNIHNNIEMKAYIAQFIPGYRYMVTQN
jgi:hypothetical protein